MEEVTGGAVDYKVIHGWFTTHCPLAPWTHAHGTDRNMSFGIKIEEDDDSIFNCFTCKTKGPLPYLLRKLSSYSGLDYSSLIEDTETTELLGSVPSDWATIRTKKLTRHTLPSPPSDDYLEIYDTAYTHPYLRKRGIDRHTASALDIRYDPDDKGAERILFPVYSREGVFYGYTGRAVKDNVEPRIRDYFGLPKMHLLLGSEFIDVDKDELVVLVEGLFDFAKLYQYGIPAVSSLHSAITDNQASILKDIGLPVLVLFDDDDAGVIGSAKVKDMLGKHLPLLKTRYPRERTVVDKATGEKRRPQDPGELSEEQAYAMIDDTRLL